MNSEFFVSTDFLHRFSSDDFLKYMPGAGGCYEFQGQANKNGELTVFCYQGKTIGPESGNLEPGGSCVEEKIKSFLLNNTCCSNDTLLQFWTPRRSSAGRTVLTISEQPFGLGHPLYYGLCRYRYNSIKVEHNDINQLGPVGRVFTGGYLEYCPNIKCYSIQEFPMKDYALMCGIERYWALPLFHRDDSGCLQQHCVGVLEGVSFGIDANPRPDILDLILEELEVLGLECPDYHRDECSQSRVQLILSHVCTAQLHDFLNQHTELPLTQIWVPCMCDGIEASIEDDENTRLLPHPILLQPELECHLELCLTMVYCCVKSGRGFVGKAYWQNRTCCLGDSSQLSISDYPLVPFTRSSGLAHCFAIPMQFIHPDYPPWILEIFLPPQHIGDGYPKAFLESLLATLAAPENDDFSIKSSQSKDDNVVYFTVCQTTNNNSCEAIASGAGKEHILTHPSTQNGAAGTSQQGVSTDTDAQIFTENGQLQMRSESFGGDQVQSHKAVVGSESQEAQFPSLQDKAKHSSSGNIFINRRKSITSDVLIQHFGKNLDEAAAVLGVSRSTLKRICRERKIDRWPWHKRNRVQGVQSLRSVEVGSEVTQDEIGQLSAREEEATASTLASMKGKSIGERDDQEEIGNSYTMMVRATYNDDTVLFPLNSDSTIDKLRRELDKRFELGAERFKIKYEYQVGDWIMISCDEDLRFRMDTLKSAGQTPMNLSVFPSNTR